MKTKLIISAFLTILLFSSCDWFMKITMPVTRITGRVIDQNENPISDVCIYLYDNNSLSDGVILVDSTFSDNEGNYKIKNSTSSYLGTPIYAVYPYKEAYMSISDYDDDFKRHVIRVDYGEKNKINITMRPLKKTNILGTVTDNETGEGINNVKVPVFYKLRNNTSQKFETKYYTYTDQSGNFNIDFYNYGYPYYCFYLKHENYWDKQIEITVKSEQSGLMDIEMQKLN
ncbi:MAG: carboxypeptidase-like regulatory domain-containing protein [Bacteroidales bacterium]|nr:carboxypeptidase-like regulatory domain-containing protein [Bacteroidales bacterium]